MTETGHRGSEQRYRCEGCGHHMTDPDEVAWHEQRHGLVINVTLDGLSHRELVTELVRLCKQRVLTCQVTPPWVVTCRRCRAQVHTDDGTGNRPGWVDAVVLGRGAALFVELKAASGRRTMSQVAMEQQVTAARGWYRLWRPSDFASGLVEQELDAIA